MINIIKQQIEIDETLKRRLEIICDFCNSTPEIMNIVLEKIKIKMILISVSNHLYLFFLILLFDYFVF